MKTILDKMMQKTDMEVIVQDTINDDGNIALLIDTIKNEKGSIKFGCEKALRIVSERHPELIYPDFDFFVELMDSENSFLKWGAILTIANLTAVDKNGKFEAAFEKYYSFIKGPQIAAAGNVIGSSIKIAENLPELTDRIVDAILKVDDATYVYKGEVSSECKNVAYQEAINAFYMLYVKTSRKKEVMDFIARQLDNTRAKASAAARKFMKKYSD